MIIFLHALPRVVHCNCVKSNQYCLIHFKRICVYKTIVPTYKQMDRVIPIYPQTFFVQGTLTTVNLEILVNETNPQNKPCMAYTRV